MKGLVLYDAAHKALEAAHTVDEVKKIIDQSAAVLEYARRAKDAKMIAWATGIKKDAARKGGAILANMAEKGERETGGRPENGVTDATVKLSDLGITKTQSSRWQKLAALDDEAFEALKTEAEQQAVASVEKTRGERNAEKKERRKAREVELGQRQIALPSKRYGVIYADPEWKFEPYSRETGMDRAADNHYPTSDAGEISARDVASIAADDCVLFLWSTAPMAPQALLVMRAWGFAYKSQCVWIKDRVGTGYWFRNKHEVLLVGTRGDVPAPAMGDQFPSAIEALVGEHSAKPEAFRQVIEAYFPTLPKIELNRRGPARPGWDAWGNETDAMARAAE